MPLTLTLLLRDAKSGQLNLLLASLIVAIATITAIALFTSRIHNAFLDEASQVLAGDGQVRGSLPIPDEWVAQARNLDLQLAFITEFQAMAFAGEEAQLGSVKAVSETYPLKGALRVSAEPYGRGELTYQGPEQGHAWVNSRLFEALQLEIGGKLELGATTLIVSGALISEPDNPQSYFNVAPRIMVNALDVSAIGAVQQGSRVSHMLTVAGEPSAVTELARWLEPQLGVHYRWLDVRTANQGMGQALNRAESFIFLAGSLSVLLAGVAIALAARRYATGRIAQVALLKTLGLGPNRIQALFLGQLALIGLMGIILGSLLGWILQWPIIYLLAQLFSTVGPASPSAYGLGALTGCIALAGFAAPPILSLKRITPAEVLRQKQDSKFLQARTTLIIGLGSVLLLIWLYSQSLWITATIALGASLCLTSAGLIARAFSRLFFLLGRKGSHQTRLGLANLERHRRHNVPQIVMFAILFMLLFSLVLVRTSLLNTWQQQLPDDAPNHFLFNIFENQREDIAEMLTEQGLAGSAYYPMVRGRLLAVNDVPVATLLERSNTRVNYERELNLTWTDELGEDNRVVAGQWWREPTGDTLLASVEDTFAEGLFIEVGDRMTFSVSGEQVTTEVANIRSVQWDSMNPNFYVVMNQPILGGVSASWITSFYLPEQDKAWLNELIRAFPTISVIELDQTIAQVQNIIAQVSGAVEFIWLLVLAAGMLVLMTSIQSTLDLRFQEGAILRVIGADRKMMRRILLIEFASIGLMAGLLAVIGAELLVYILQKRLFEAPYQWHWQLWFLGPLLCAVLVAIIGLISTRKILQQPPMGVLRGVS